MLKPSAYFLFLSLFPLMLFAEFIASQPNADGDIFVLCEGQREVFVAEPSGSLFQVPLDANHQARIKPGAQGPYTIQCGEKTITLKIAPKATEQAFNKRAFSFDYALETALVFLFSLAALMLIAYRLALAAFQPRTEFFKLRSGERVRLSVFAGCDLNEVAISDPQGGEGGSPISLSIPKIEKGQVWSWEYEFEGSEEVKPATLTAKSERGKLICLTSKSESQSLLGAISNALGAESSRKSPTKRKIPKAQ